MCVCVWLNWVNFSCIILFSCNFLCTFKLKFIFKLAFIFKFIYFQIIIYFHIIIFIEFYLFFFLFINFLFFYILNIFPYAANLFISIYAYLCIAMYVIFSHLLCFLLRCNDKLFFYMQTTLCICITQLLSTVVIMSFFYYFMRKRLVCFSHLFTVNYAWMFKNAVSFLAFKRKRKCYWILKYFTCLFKCIDLLNIFVIACGNCIGMSISIEITFIYIDTYERCVCVGNAHIH